MTGEQQARLTGFNQALQDLMQRYGVTLAARLDTETLETRRGQEQRTVAVVVPVLLEAWPPPARLES